MLSLESHLESRGTIIYRDHADPRLFYYTAPHPKISKTSGRMMFDMHIYAVELKHSPLSGTSIPDELGAGFLTMTVDCEMQKSELNAIRDELSTISEIPVDEVVLSPIAYKKGTVRILALDKYSEPAESPSPPDSPSPLTNRPTFVEAIMGSSTPALLGDLRSIFSLSLSQEGVTFLEGLFSDESAPVGIVYDLTFLGLRPAVDVEITADLSRIYKHFGGGIKGQYKWLKVDVSTALDYLKEAGAIDINILSQATGEQATKSKELAMSLFKDRIVKDMFKATPQPSSSGNASGAIRSLGSSSSSGSIALSLKYKKSEELKTVVYNFSEEAPEEQIHSPQGFLPMMITSTELEDRIHKVDLDNEFFDLLEVLVTGPSPEEFASLGIRQVEAVLSYGSENEDVEIDSETLLFRAEDTGDKTFAVRRKQRTSLSYSYSLVYEFSRSGSVDTDSFRYELAPRSSTGRTLRINPCADFAVLDVEIEPGRIHKDISSVDVDLSYVSQEGDFKACEKVRLDLNPEVKSKNHWQVRTSDTELTQYQARYSFYFNDGTEYVAPEQSFSEPLLRVDSPFKNERSLLIRPNVVSEEICQISIEIDYQDSVNNYQRQLLINIDPPFDSKQVSWPILDTGTRMISYRATVHEPGFISEAEWIETEDPSIVVGAWGSRNAVVTIRLIGPGLSDIGLDAVLIKVELAGDETEENQQSILLTGEDNSAEIRLTLPPDTQLKYRYQTLAFKGDGSTAESIWKESTSTILPLSTRSL